ncbi:prepilin-type N-terminal cleavage/methylation domain-containing protein [PVC group bacterium]|nr:prepilin-type N-terminal cleavage/methylation domain-containing protein [PVC group bacterium]
MIKYCPRSGFTLIELILVIIILGVALVGLMDQFSLVITRTAKPVSTYVALNLAQGLLAEVLSKDFEDTGLPAGSFGREAGELLAGPRNLFDDVDDYDDWTSQPPQDRQGLVLSDFTQYTRNVIVANVLSDDLDSDTTDGSTDYKKIQVQVLWLSDEEVVLSGLKIKK